VALLVTIAQAGRDDDFVTNLRRNGLAVETEPDLMGLLEAAGKKLDAAGTGGAEISDVGTLARRALLGTLYAKFERELPGLFPALDDLQRAARRFSTPAGFSELARAFYTRMRRCCRTLTVKDSHHESKRLDGRHEQAQARPLPHDELVRLQRCADEARVSADLAGQGDGLARAA
jgi:hypothetical protein